MAPRRVAGATDITLEVDGVKVPAREGEPVALALVAAGRWLFGRSVKYHRARGPVCFSGRCDGCLMRVDGAPSRMTCRVPARPGMKVETQNVLGSAKLDLLATTDLVFDQGMNHHEMFTWSKVGNRAMQIAARQIAGIGRLPTEAAAVASAKERMVDVTVIGGGVSGMSAAITARGQGLTVLLLESDAQLGGRLLRTREPVHSGGTPVEPRLLAQRLSAALADAGVEVLTSHPAVGIYPLSSSEDRCRFSTLADSGSEMLRIQSRSVIIAQGREEGSAAFHGSDLPGVIQSQAALRMLEQGVLPGSRVILAGSPNSDALRAIREMIELAGGTTIGPVELSRIARAGGRNQVRSCDFESAEQSVERVSSDAIVIAPPSSSVFELACQAGAKCEFREGVFELCASLEDGATGVPGLRVVGSACGSSSVEHSIVSAGQAVSSLAQELARP